MVSTTALKEQVSERFSRMDRVLVVIVGVFLSFCICNVFIHRMPFNIQSYCMFFAVSFLGVSVDHTGAQLSYKFKAVSAKTEFILSFVT